MNMLDKLIDFIKSGKLTSDGDFYKSIIEQKELLDAATEFRFGGHSALKRSLWWEVFDRKTGYIPHHEGSYNFTRDEAIAKARELNKG